MKTFDAGDLQQWRKWLAAHHDSESEVWLVFHKLHTGRACIAYDDALDEALCFGWVDSLVKHLYEARYARKFTPRRSDSKWSEVNRKRYAQLKASGRLMPAGANRPPTDRTYDAPPPRRTSSRVPQYIRETLTRHPTALSHFENLPSSQRRRYLNWIDTARQAETKSRRLQEATRLLAAGRELGLK